MEHFGLYPIEYSIPANEAGGISEPEYLERLEAFTELPARAGARDARVLDLGHHEAAQPQHARGRRQLLPHSGTTAICRRSTCCSTSFRCRTAGSERPHQRRQVGDARHRHGRAGELRAETKAFFNDVDAWQQENLPSYMHAKPTSAAVMFTYISERNMENMVVGTILAIAAIAVIMMFALQSVRLGTLSLVPNGLPILVTFGTWALIVGRSRLLGRDCRFDLARHHRRRHRALVVEVRARS